MKTELLMSLILCAGSLLYSGCSSDEYSPAKGETLRELLQEKPPFSGDEPVVLTEAEIAQMTNLMKNVNPDPVLPGEFAVMETSLGYIIFEFYPDSAANHCANFKKLANNGFYDWTTFHRVIPGFMIQGGDINSKNDNASDDGSGSPGYTVNAEFNGIPHKPGTLSMARAASPNSAGSQFFICHGTPSHLNGQYTVFGNVVEGMDVVDAIANVGRDTSNNRPFENVYIKKVRVIKP
ncbi:peptidylprolyl isomerase [candidate division KSB1 bacterium]